MTATATTTAVKYLALTVMDTLNYRVYAILFANEALALDYMARHPWELDGTRSTTYVTAEAEEAELTEAQRAMVRGIDPETDPTLYDRLYPTCEHNLSGNLCYGPAHYATDAEIARGF